MPAAWPDQICQVTLNFVCAMQFNTYRQMEGVPAATTFVTNHIRQIGSNLAKLARHPEDHGLRRKVKAHTSLLLCFTAGAVISTMLCEAFSYRSLLGALIPLGCTLVRLVHDDLVLERGQLDVVPHGHKGESLFSDSSLAAYGFRPASGIFCIQDGCSERIDPALSDALAPGCIVAGADAPAVVPAAAFVPSFDEAITR